MTTMINLVRFLILLMRHVLFYTALVAWFLCCLPIFMILLCFPSRCMQRGCTLFCHSLMALMAVFLGLRYRVTGTENLPRQGGYIVASKHQSAWETVAFLTFLPNPVFVLKQEMLRVPAVGVILSHLGMIPVSRRSRASKSNSANTSTTNGTTATTASKSTSATHDAFLHQGKAIIDQHRPVVIFPEGTRTLPGQQIRYHQGVIRLAEYTGAPIIPLALNSGVFWPRHTFFKKPGIIKVVILPPLLPDQQDDIPLLQRLKTSIETASSNLLQ